ncbi:purine catabolism regulatory protein PucR [Gottschalkia purinilytica]|uniref:Purine catabolism regulatory protein PucR n=1 Tax=Gottschalkia purinilytica TaxID=1503 RepID=A0A0L0W6Z6_GOTPU|nr:PucR family transcriptional regulator [Gottschalkia purinilytica]KNF07035.1 purine catabolism regulatory protein PucR [Gottschalkia purinilytica]
MGRQNGITIEDALNMECMKNCKIISGYKGIRNTMSSVNVMADPDISSWIGEGDFLLTTGYSLNKISLEEQKNLIRECSKKGLAGIGVKISPYLESLPYEVLSLSEELNFPIIDIHSDTPLSDIMTPIFNEIFNRQAYLLKKIEKIYEQFMNAMLNGFDIEEVTKLISDNIKNPIIVKLEFPDTMIKKLEFCDDSIKKILINNMEHFYINHEKYKEKKIDETNELINSKYVKRMVVPIIAKDSVFGHIFAWGINSSLGGYDLSVLEIASTTMALEVLKVLSLREVENRYKSEFIEDLISLDEKRKEKAIDRASFFNLNRRDNFLSITFKIKNKEDHFNKIDLTTDSLQQYISNIHDNIEKILENLNITGIVASKIERMMVLVSFRSDMEIKGVIDNLVEQIDLMIEKYERIDLRVGIGRVYKGLESFNSSYTDSVKAISAGKILSESSVVRFEDLGIFKILCQEHLEEELVKFYNSTIRSLVEYDSRKSTELVKTLEAYFLNNGNLKKMSDSLFTHYNTVLYRIQRIKEITGMDLENPNDRLNLEISLKIKQLLKK